MQRRFELSVGQRNIFSLEQANFGTPINNICATVRIKGQVSAQLIKKAIEHELRVNSTLRIRITRDEKQYVTENEPETFPVYDFTSTDREGFSHWESAVAKEAMAFFDAPLYRFYIYKLGENEGGVVVKCHHIISDGWSQVMMANRIAKTYLDLLSKRDADTTELPEYERHVLNEREYLSSPSYVRDRRHWEGQMEKLDAAASLKEAACASVSRVGKRRDYRLPDTVNNAIRAFCDENRVAPFSVFYMALAIYIRRVTGAKRFSLGVPIFNRSDFADKNTMGMFVSTMPFLGEVDDDWSLVRFNEALTDEWYDLLRHQRFPFEDIKKAAKAKHPDINSLFSIVLSYQNSKIMENEDASVYFSGMWHYSGYQSEQLTIHLCELTGDGRFTVTYDYLTQLFSTEEIDSLHGYLVNILNEALKEPDKPIRELAVIGAAERERVLYDFNKTDKYFPKLDMYTLLLRGASAHANRAAVIEGDRRYTYAELIKRARDYAAEAGGKKEPVAVVLKKGFELYCAVVGLMQAGAPWVLLPEDIPAKRLEEILADSGATAVFTTGRTAAEKLPRTANLRVVCTDGADFGMAEPADVERSQDDLAYIVYTSGSTGKPKGVEIESKSVVNLASAMEEVYGHGAVLSLCNVGFDAFVLESAAALLNGRTIVLPGDGDTEDAEALAALIRRYAVGFMSLTPSRLHAYTRNASFAQSLSRLETIVCGGEHFPPELLYELKQMTNARIYNQYGPSETTVAVGAKLLNDASSITVGKPMDNCRMYVLNEDLLPLPVGIYGELYVGGVCVGRGYRNQQSDAFTQNPFEHGKRMYKTGDIARWTEDGEIDIAGRSDEQVKLRGLRIEPNEVASRLCLYAGVTGAAARVTSKGLVCWYTSNKSISAAKLASFLATYLPAYMIPTRFVAVDDIPTGKNGKVDFEALPLPAAQTSGVFASGRARRVAELFAASLGIESFAADGDYFAAGGDSLKAMELLSNIEREFSTRLRTADLFALKTPVAIAELITAGEQASAVQELQKANKRDAYPLTAMQKSLFIETSMNPTGTTYNMPGALELPKGTDIERLTAALRDVVQDEPMLRAYFEYDESGVCMKVASSVAFSVESTDGSGFVRPFDLSRPPLFRAGTDGARLFVDMHHIIADGVSMPLLIERLNRSYEGKGRGAKAPDERINFTDFMCAETKTDEALLAYWKEKAKNACASDIPTDLPRQSGTRAFDYKGEKHLFSFSESTSRELNEYCANTGVTPFNVLSCAFALLVGTVSGEDAVTLGIPVSGRRKYGLWDVFGPFINTLPLVLDFCGKGTLKDALSHARDETIALLDNQDASLFDIMSVRGKDNEKLFNAIFNLRPVDETEIDFLGGTVRTEEFQTHSAKADLVLEATDTKGGFTFSFEYAASLFKPETIAFYSRCFERGVEQLIRRGDLALTELDLLCEADRFELIDKADNTYYPYLNMAMDARADTAARRFPQRAAVICDGRTTTYSELIQRADALAGLLQENGVRRGDFIGIAARRTPDFIAAMLAILKAGAAYVPMLASFPESRLSYMTRISGAKLVLTDEATQKELPKSDCPTLVMRFDHKAYAPVPDRSQEDIMHVLFTSGSTGEPKGVMLPHRSINNLLPSLEEMINEGTSPILCCTNCIFDTFITETLYPIALGMTIVMAREEDMLLPWRLAELMRQYGVKTVQMTPSRMNMSLENEAFFSAMKEVKTALVCGEVFSAALAAKLRRATDAKLINLYGPTETSVYTTAADLAHREDMVVGCPLRNCRVYCLNENMKRVLPTARGELYVAGECVSKGYIGREDLTEAAFLQDVFYPDKTMYKTGDIARLKLDGSYDFIGRRDHQIKLNGQRVELGEINTLLLKCEGVSEAAVTVQKKDDGSASLSAFVVMKDGGAFSADAIKKQLAKSLPKYMIPSAIAQLTELPRTASGKTDIRALSHTQNTDAKRKADEAAKADAETPAGVPDSTPNAVSAEARDEARDGEAAESAARPVEIPREADTATREAAQTADTTAQTADATAHTADELAFTAAFIRKTVEKTWRDTLERDECDESAEFFDMGGTSLAALRVLSRYFCAGLSMTMEQFYAHPTIAAQCALFCEKYAAKDEEEAAQAAESASACVCVSVGTNAVASAAVGAEAGGGAERIDRIEKSVLLTGATGFLGAHLLRELIENGAKNVVCPIRGGNSARLFTSLAYYFGDDWVKANADFIETAPGNINSRSIIEAPYQRRRAIEHTELVVHAAADVRHYGTSVETNSEGARNAALFAAQANAKLLHISTISVCGDFLVAEPNRRYAFTENDFEMGQNWRANAYVKGKFLAEKAVRELMEQGLDARIFRIGRLVGRAKDGKFQRNRDSSAFYAFCAGLRSLEKLPARFADLPIELSGVDETARNVIAMRDSSRRVFHLFNDKSVTLTELASAFCPRTELVTDDEFEAHLADLIRRGNGDALATILEVWTRYKITPFSVEPNCYATTAELEAAGLGFSEPDVSVLLGAFFEKGGI